MCKRNRILPILGFLTGVLLLNGCAPATATAVPTAEVPQSTATPKSALPTATAVPAVTDTPTSTLALPPTPTPVNTPTLMPSPTPNMVMPGNYYVGRCADTILEHDVKMKFCVTGVRVNSERHMFYDVSWAVSNVTDPLGYVNKDSYNSRDIYLTDNLGNRYDHIAGGGEAYRSSILETDKPSSGWFEFGASPVDALRFDFHDKIDHILISEITLIPGYGFIQYDTLTLDQYPLIIEYDKDKWDPVKSGDNTNMLTHKTIPSCTLQPKSPSEPVGKFKNLIADGDIDYKIYGYFDDAQDLYIREYVYESGIKGLDPSIKPFFFVTIPADTSLECIVAVNNVLARLAIPEQ
jgi:hypothetical protein